MLAKLLGKSSYALALTLGVVASLILGQTLAAVLVQLVPVSANASVLATIMAALGYILALLLALGIPALLMRKFVSLQTLGMQRLLSWSDIGLSILSVLPYYILASVLLYIGSEVFTLIDPDVGQQLSFDNLSLRIEYVVAFMTLVVFAPVAEEILFRGYFQGRLSDKIGKWLGVLIVAIVFGLMHLVAFSEAGLVLQWGAAADTFAMGLVAGLLRILTGSIWAGVLLHAIKNAIAYYFLFISPLPPGGM
jgi:membrane protease YdiL (CAAX protease family)